MSERAPIVNEFRSGAPFVSDPLDEIELTKLVAAADVLKITRVSFASVVVE